MKALAGFVLLFTLIIIALSLLGLTVTIFRNNGDCQFDSGRYFIREVEKGSGTNFTCNCNFQGEKYYPFMLDRYGKHGKDEMLSKFVNMTVNNSSNPSINFSFTVPKNYGRID